MNIYTATGFNDGAFPTNVTVKNVETINYNNANAGVDIDASKFVGATLINQTGSIGNVSNLAATTTAAFNGVLDNDVTAADDAASVTLDVTKAEEWAWVDVMATATGALSTINVKGTMVDADGDGEIGEMDMHVTVGKDVETLTINSEANLELHSISDGAGTKVIRTVNASASTGNIFYNTGSATIATVLTGAGNDEVSIDTSLNATVKAASVSTGAGKDVIDVNVVVGTAAAGQTVTVDAGEGNDEINLSIATGVAYDVKGGAGDDVVAVAGTVMTTDKIDGGDGIDTISLAGKATYVADDYIVFNKVLTNFETLKLTTAGTLDLSQLAANYTTVDLASTSTALKVGTQALVANGDLTAEAAGVVFNTAGNNTSGVKTYAGSLNITEKATGNVTAFADTVNLTVQGGKGNAPAAVDSVLLGDAKSAAVTLVAGTDTKGTVATADDTLVASKITVTADVTAGALKDLASLTLSGNGTAVVANNAGSALVTVNASALNSVDVAGKAVAGLDYASANTKAETITLGGGIDKVTIGASTYAAADTITGLNLVLNAGKTALTAASDTLIVTGISTGADTTKFTTTQTDLDLALKDAAALAGENEVVFHLGGNTYVYKDVAAGGDNLVDAGDILVKLTGTVDLDALLVALG